MTARISHWRRYAVVLVAMLTLSACGQQAVRDPKVLVVGRSQDSRNLDPAFEAFLTDGTIMELAYERLLREKQVDGVPTGEFEGVLAERWESDDSKTQWTFYLRRDHRFDDGSPVTAQAFVFSLERSFKVQPGTEANFFWLKRYEVVDDYTLRFELKYPFPTFLHFLAVFAVVINPAVVDHAYKDDLGAAWLSEHSAGSGPYRVENWARGQQIVMTRNPHHPDGAKYFDRIVFRVFRDGNARRAEFAKRAFDIFEGLSVDQLTDVQNMPGVDVINKPSSQLLFLDYNNQHPILRDVRVRRALSLAIDYKRLVESVANGAGDYLNGPIPKGMPGYDMSLPQPVRNLDAARRLLKDAGHEKLAFTLSYVQGGGTINAMALLIQSNLADAGIALTLEPLAPSANVNKMLGGEYDLMLNSFVAGFADPWLVTFPLYYSGAWGAGGNTPRYKNEAVDALLIKAQSTLDRDARIALYQEAQRLILNDAPRAFLMLTNGLLAYRTDIKGMHYSTWRPLVYNVWDMYRE